MSIQEFVEKFAIEIARIDFRRAIFPPTRRVFSMMEANMTELAGIGEDERALLLIQHKVVMFARLEIRRFDVRFSGHSKMNTEPIIAGSREQHLFSTSV